jgi:hypothetical protein
MSTSGIVGEEIDRQAAQFTQASEKLQDLSGIGAGTNAKQLLPRAVLAMIGPISAAKFFAERVLQSPTFDAELVQAIHSKLIGFERMADDRLNFARRRGYFGDPDTGEPLRWLEACNEQVKDCMVALESMLDPELDDLMAAALEEHQRGETVPLDSLR